MNESTIDDRRDAGCVYHGLVETVRVLRDPGGCPWDAEQTHASLRPNLLEECYEALDALDNGDADALKEELGDLLIQIVFHADIARRNSDFDADDIVDATNEKLRRRHAHVFGDADAIDSAEGVVDRWEQIKREEAGGVRSIVASVPRALPAIAQAALLIRRANRAGLDLSEHAVIPNDKSGKVTERSAGQMLIARVSAIQSAGIDPETALRGECNRLRERILRAEELAGETALADLDELERTRIWQEAGTNTN